MDRSGRDSINMKTQEYLGCVPLVWKAITFWGEAPASASTLASVHYSGYWAWGLPDEGAVYHISLVDNVWQLVTGYWGVNEKLIYLSESAALSGAGLVELLACVGVLIKERLDPETVFFEDDQLLMLMKRWRSWYATPPTWLGNLERTSS